MIDWLIGWLIVTYLICVFFFSETNEIAWLKWGKQTKKKALRKKPIAIIVAMTLTKLDDI